MLYILLVPTADFQSSVITHVDAVDDLVCVLPQFDNNILFPAAHIYMFVFKWNYCKISNISTPNPKT